MCMKTTQHSFMKLKMFKLSFIQLRKDTFTLIGLSFAMHYYFVHDGCSEVF